MFTHVYVTDLTASEEQRATEMLSMLYEFFKKNPKKMPDFYVGLLKTYSLDRDVCDYISSMTDRYAVGLFEEVFVPKKFINIAGKKELNDKI